MQSVFFFQTLKTKNVTLFCPGNSETEFLKCKLSHLDNT